MGNGIIRRFLKEKGYDSVYVSRHSLQNAHLFLYILPDLRVIFTEEKGKTFCPELNTYHFTPRLEREGTPRGQLWNEASKLH